ncbi:IclR family transcriptional regulator [Streptomyces mirabilis]|uniref:IclR family transcriptional regulator n=1 Tax=Streptomyces mirabilis TaxID=68239 RepID=UPI0033B931AE
MTMALPTEIETAARPPSMIERMTKILECFEGAHTRLLLEEVCRRTGLPRSTSHRILEQLVQLQWVEHTRSGYHLGRRVRSWGARESGHSALRAAAAPRLHDLSVRTDLVVHLAVLDATFVEYLDKVGGRRAAAVASRVGGRAPAHCTALGKAMLAWLPPEEIDALYEDGVPAATDGSITDLAHLHRELGRIRSTSGVAIERGECVESIACVGAAIRGPEGPVGAISLVGRKVSPLERVAPLVHDVAQRIALDLFGAESARAQRARRG